MLPDEVVQHYIETLHQVPDEVVQHYTETLHQDDRH